MAKFVKINAANTHSEVWINPDNVASVAKVNAGETLIWEVGGEGPWRVYSSLKDVMRLLGHEED